MEKRKICQWLNRMDREERVQWGHYLRSPLHSHRPQLAEMLGHLEELVLGKEEQTCSSERYWEAVYPGKPYNANLLNRLLSEMTAELKGFLSLRRYQQDGAAQQINLMREFRHRGWRDVIPRALKEARKRLETELPQDERYYYHRLQLAIEQVDYDTDHLGKDPGPIYQDAMDQLDSFYLIGKLKYYCNAKNHDRIHSKGHKIRFSSVLQELDKYEEIKSDAKISLFYKFYQTLVDSKNDELLRTFLDSLLGKGPAPESSLSSEEANFFYLHSINSCINRLNSGDSSWVDYYFELNLASIKMGFFTVNGRLNERYFINISAMLSKFKRFSQSEEFILEYYQKLDGHKENPAFSFSRGMNLFYQGFLMESMPFFLSSKNRITQKTDAGIALNIRGVICRCLFELKQFDSLGYELNSFRAFLGRVTQMSKKRLLPYNNYCKHIQKLDRAIHLQDKKLKIKRLNELKKSLVNPSNFLGYKWLYKITEDEIKKVTP